MKKIILACLLATTGASAIAEWTEVGETADATFYLDFQSIRKDGNLRKAWEIQDLKQRHKDGEMSRRLRMEYNCKAETFRVLSSSEHSAAMANGGTLLTKNNPSEWQNIPPGTVGETKLKIVCAK